MRLVIFSDLDGTLLDEDYSYAAALPALRRLDELGVPLVLVTSKTRAEVEPLHRELRLGEPFVVENGAAILFPPACRDLCGDEATSHAGYRALVLGRPYSEVRGAFAELRRRFPIEGFGDMSAERIAELTDLEPEAAEAARRREFTEPFRIADAARLEELTSAATDLGFAVTTGGRLHHLIGSGQDKGRAVRRLIGLYTRHLGETVLSVGLGDGPNDLPMLEAVDLPVVVPRPNGSSLELPRAEAMYAERPGAAGWSAAVFAVLDRRLDQRAGDRPDPAPTRLTR